MADPDPDASVGRHVASVAARTAAETDMLLSAVRARCWPSGTADRTDATAAEWLRRWRPVRGMVPTVACGCATGPCAVCN